MYLSKEIIFRICDILSYNDICNYRLTCKYYYTIIKFKSLNKTFWKNNVLNKIQDKELIEDFICKDLDFFPVLINKIKFEKNISKEIEIVDKYEIYKIDNNEINKVGIKKIHELFFYKNEKGKWFFNNWYLIFKEFVLTYNFLINNRNILNKIIEKRINIFGTKSIDIIIYIPSFYKKKKNDDIIIGFNIYGNNSYWYRHEKLNDLII